MPNGSARVCDHRDGLGVAVGVDEEHRAGGLADATAQRHRLCGRGALVEHGGVGQIHAGQLGHHRLVVEQRLESALADLGLVGGVRRVPGRVLHDVAQDHPRRDRVRVAHPDQAGEDLVPVSDRPRARRGQLASDCGPARTSGVSRRIELGHGLFDQFARSSPRRWRRASPPGRRCRGRGGGPRIPRRGRGLRDERSWLILAVVAMGDEGNGDDGAGHVGAPNVGDDAGCRVGGGSVAT